MNNIERKYAIIDNFDKTVMFFDKSVRLYNGIKIYNVIFFLYFFLFILFCFYSKYKFSDLIIFYW